MLPEIVRRLKPRGTKSSEELSVFMFACVCVHGLVLHYRAVTVHRPGVMGLENHIKTFL